MTTSISTTLGHPRHRRLGNEESVEYPPCVDGDSPRGCLNTSGCSQLLEIENFEVAGDIFLSLPRFSREHVIGLVREFASRLGRLMYRVDLALETVGLRVLSDHLGIAELNPTWANSTDCIRGWEQRNHVALCETRWWLTAIEAALQLVHSTGQLDHSDSLSLIEYSQTASTFLNDLLQVFGVDPAGLPSTAVCRMSQSLTNRLTHTMTSEFNAVALRDVRNALIRIRDVIRFCDVEPHSMGLHRVRLLCAPHSSVFYERIPGSFEGSRNLFTFEFYAISR